MSTNLNLFFDTKQNDDDVDITDYLVHCYLYYIKNTPIIEDTEFDLLCRKILDKWNNIWHKYKNLLSIDDLKAGTGYSIKKYPEDIINDAKKRLEKEKLNQVYEINNDDDICFTNVSTYFLIGLYRTFRHFSKNSDKEKMKKEMAQEELKKRWKKNKEEFEEYFNNYSITEKDICL